MCKKQYCQMPTDVDLRMYVDSDHSGDKRNCRSRTRFFINMNSVLVMWLSKKQATIKMSVFGAEFVVVKVKIKILWGLCSKLCMIGIAISGPTYIYGDDMSVIHNMQRPKQHSRSSPMWSAMQYGNMWQWVHHQQDISRQQRTQQILQQRWWQMDRVGNY